MIHIHRSSLFLPALALLPAPVLAAEARKVVDVPVSFFSESGSTAEVVSKLVRDSFLQGVFGFENVGGSARPISVTMGETSVGFVLREICRQDARYEVVETGDPEIVNLLASDSRSPGHPVLDFRMPRLDVEISELTENVISMLPDFSPELREYLTKVYLQAGGKIMTESGAIAGMAGNARLPHFSIHLKDVSVREALNSIAVQSFRLYQAAGRDPRMIHTPDEFVVVPSGWELEFRSPGDMSLARWMREIFKYLE
jgi:hypothetical protein